VALLEAPLVEHGTLGDQAFGKESRRSVGTMYERGDKVGATDAFLTAVVGTGLSQFMAKLLPPGAF